MELNDSHKIAKLNDELRINGIGGKSLCTTEFNELSEEVKLKACLALQNFEDFNKNNDPYGEHDRAIVKVPELKKAFEFKIIYLERGLNCAFDSYALADPEATERVIIVDVAHFIE